MAKTYLEPFHGLYIRLGGLGCILGWICESIAFEISEKNISQKPMDHVRNLLCSRIAMATVPILLRSFDDFVINLLCTDNLHHSQMLEVIMRLEQCVTREKFH